MQISPQQLLAIIGAKEVEIVLLKEAIESLRARVSELEKPKDAVQTVATEP
jgi:prefoldin subunit 5